MQELRASTHAISNSGLERIAPAIFANHPNHEVSDRYAFVPTIKVVDKLRDAGWYPSYVACTGHHNNMTSRHQIRFRRLGGQKIHQLGDSDFELILNNSHDRTSTFQMDAGLYRKVCDNGLIVRDTTLTSINVRHTGDAPELILEESENLSDNIPMIEEKINEWMNLEITSISEQWLAEQAAALRWGKESPIQPYELLQAHRYADYGNDLWAVFNRIQENLLKGGTRGRSSTGRRMTTRAISAIDTSNRLNRKLWETAQVVADVTNGKIDLPVSL